MYYKSLSRFKVYLFKFHSNQTILSSQDSDNLLVIVRAIEKESERERERMRNRREKER